MSVRYAVVSRADIWLLFEGGREIDALDSSDLVAAAGRGLAQVFDQAASLRVS